MVLGRGSRVGSCAALAVIVTAGSAGCALFEREIEPRDECNGVDAIPAVVDEDFRANDDCDVIQQTVVVEDARLTVEPGTTLEFSEGAGLDIGEGGRLDAVGTSREPIVFTGTDTRVGAWKGIRIGERSGRSVIEETTVEFAGGDGWIGAERANVVVDGGHLELESVTLADSAGLGLWMGGDDARVLLTGANAITANAEEPVRATPQLVEGLNAESSYRGNASDFIRVTEGTIRRSSVWENLNVPIWIDGTVSLNAHLFIEAGNELVFSDDAAIETDHNGELDVEDD